MDRKFIISFHRKDITCLCDLKYFYGNKTITEIAQGKEIQESVGLRIPFSLSLELESRFRIVSWDFEFLEIYSGFQSPVFQTPQAKISRFPDSRVPDSGSLTKATDIKSFCFSNLKNLLKFSEFHPQPSTKYIGQSCTLTNDMTNHVQRVPSSWK